MKEKLNTVVLVPYVASGESKETPTAEAQFLYQDYFNEAKTAQILGSNLEGRMYVKDQIGLYIIGEGKTNASMYCSALLNNDQFDLSDSKFILFGCCGCARDLGVVGDIYLVGETVDYELGHHADSREDGASASHSWYPNESFSRFGYIDLQTDFFNKAYDLIKDEKPQTTENAKNFMAKTFNNEAWAIRDPQIMQVSSVTADSYWKGNYDHTNAKYVSDYYKCKLPFGVTDMEDIAVAQVFKQYNKLDNFLILRYAVNTDVFMAGQNPELIWGEGKGSFDSSGFDNFNDAFPVATKRATEILLKLL